MHMGRIEAARFNLFDLESYDASRSPKDKPRVATPREIAAYARDLATRAGLYPYEEFDVIAGAVTFGEKLKDSSFERVGGEYVRIEAVYADGAYSVPLPGRNRRETVTMEILDGDGAVLSSRTMPTEPKKGGIVWDKAAVAKAVGPVEKVKRPRAPKVERISDSEVLRLYCEERAADMAAAQDAASAAAAIARLIASIDIPAPDMSEIQEPEEAAQMIQEDAGAELAGEQPEASATAPEPAKTPHGDAMEAAGQVIGELIAGLMRRVDALEAQLATRSAETDPLSVESEQPRRSAARERLLRRYLAMRRQRELDRAALVADREYLAKIEAQRDEALESRKRLLNRPAPVQHRNEPDPGIIAQMQKERAQAAAKLESAEQRADAMERAMERLSAELLETKGRALRAEQALLVYRVAPPALPIAYPGANVARVNYGGAI